MAEEYKEYPPPHSRRSGAKVAWHYYKTIEEAAICSDAARHNAELKRQAGFDFGFQYPGNIHKSYFKHHEDELYEVCIC